LNDALFAASYIGLGDLSNARERIERLNAARDRFTFEGFLATTVPQSERRSEILKPLYELGLVPTPESLTVN
jgi:hypothetical protein